MHLASKLHQNTNGRTEIIMRKMVLVSALLIAASLSLAVMTKSLLAAPKWDGEVTINTVCYAKQSHYVMWQFGARSKFLVIDPREEILQIDSPAHRCRCFQYIEEIFSFRVDAVVKGVHKRASVQEKTFRERPSANNA